MYARQEKNFMKDPLTAPARIYVGNLDQSVVEDDLRGLFSSYGKILGISVQRNFGFIQFDSEQSAQLAIQKELGNIFKGKKLNVRGAITGEGGKGNNNLKNIQTTTTTTTSALIDNNIEQQQQQQQQQHDEQQQQQQTNVKTEQQQQQSINNTITNQLYPRRGGPGLGPSGRNNNNYRDRSPLDHHHQQQQPRNYQQQQQQQRYSFNNNRQQQQQHGGSGVNVNKKIDCNDCEIIVVAKSLTEYAEYIENKLKLHGLTVDLLFPNEDVPIGRVLANIASRGCLYAILVTPQNEQYHSLTLNILYGATEEHRNMPTDDAINLIHKNFECYLHNGGNIINNNNNNILNKLLIKHSDTIQILLNLLTENRLLSCIQYDILIKYLQERKQLQQQYEQQQQQQTNITTNDNNINNNDNNNTDNIEANELQTRILNILNKTTTTTNNDDNNITTIVNDKTTVLNDIVTSVISKINNKTTTTTNTTNTPPPPPPLLNDPSVQKALDSLLQADLLKNITIQQQQQHLQQHTNDINNESNNNDNNEHYGINYSSNIRRF